MKDLNMTPLKSSTLVSFNLKKSTISPIMIFALALVLMVGFLSAQNSVAQISNIKPMPAEVAGEIPAASGSIAFIRNSNIFVMNVDGSNEMLACRATNAYGRLSWSPDNRQIAFTRRGQVEIQGTNLLGGKHRLYDIFKVMMDSVGINSDWWEQVTTGNGGRYPEWSADGESILYTNDFNANFVDSDFPNYQMSRVDPFGASPAPIRKDYQQTEYLSINPTAGPDGRYAFVALFEQKPQGMVITEPGDPMPSMESVRKQSRKMIQAIAPSWSPDGKWIAYVYNDINMPAIFIVSPDLKQKYVVYPPNAGSPPSTNSPGWSSDSKWLTFATGDGSLWISDVTGNQRKQISPALGNIAPAWSK